ncbi:winged helix-turn-helix transcriptional regulator [Selenomonas sputigena]|uniref:Winged helix-turn-helix transcriptional regulator n=1 Tax=Selenomonas sputigena TaxID=69823 RepID=A0ABV3X656_9FIRM
MQEDVTGRDDFVEQIVAESGPFLNTAVAFANGRGGRIVFFGESGRGFSAEDEIILYIDKVTQEIFDECEPRIFPRVGVEEQDGRQVIVIEILPGMEKPYFLKKAGMIDGTYVRTGGATRLAEPYQVQELLLSGTNSSMDQLAGSDTVDEVEIEEFCRRIYGEACKRRGEDAEIARLMRENLLGWKLLCEEGDVCRPANGWHLLTGTAEKFFPEAFIQCAEYLGTTRLDFVDGAEFTGSLMEQIDGAAAYISARLAARGERARGLEEIAAKLLHRLVARAVCQRNYLAPGCISFVLYEDRLEINVPGLLEEDMTVWKLKTGFAKIRNRGIAAAFFYMGLMTGFHSILPELYRAAKAARLPEPAVIALGDSVRINIYCREEMEQAAPEGAETQQEEALCETAEETDVASAEAASKEAAKGFAAEEEEEPASEAAEAAFLTGAEEAFSPEAAEEPEPETASLPDMEEPEPETASLPDMEEPEPEAILSPELEEEPEDGGGMPDEPAEAPEPDEVPLPDSAEPEAEETLLSEPDEAPVPEMDEEPAAAAEEVRTTEDGAGTEAESYAQQEMEFDTEEPMEEKLLRLLREDPKITQKALKESLGVSIATVKRMTTALNKKGIIERVGTNRSGAWRILKDNA